MHSLLPARSAVAFYPLQLHIGLHEMLGSFDAQRSDSQEASGGTSDPEFSSPHDLLLECAQAVSQGEWQRSVRLIALLLQNVSSEGDSSDRVITQFADSLASRVVHAIGQRQAAQLPDPQRFQYRPTPQETQAAYLEFNQITPFIRFSHLTANQAILEALRGEPDALHIVDLEIMQGVQWPPFMQALVERSVNRPPRLRISGIGSDTDVLEQTGNRLMKFAASLGLPFEFRALHANRIEEISSFMLDTRPGEALAVNCVLQLHRPQGEQLGSFLRMIQALQPRVVTLVERETSYSQPIFFDRFMEAFQHYSALFDSLEATLPPRSVERINVERIWFRQEIMSVLAFEDMENMQGSSSKWRDLFKEEGFNLVPHSTFALSQARLLLRLHYPSEGYQLREEDDCLLLGWRNVPLFGVSAWN